MAELRAALVEAATSLSSPPAPAMKRARSAETLAAPSTPTSPTLSLRQETAAAGRGKDLVAPPRSRRGLLFLGVAALVVVAAGNTGVRRQASRLLARAGAPQRPATVRVNFSSDPDGAIVSRSDGSVLGVTPLSTEIPYSDRPVDYRVHKEGYASKVSSFVPNLPSPVFVLLEKIEQRQAAPSAPPAAAPSLADILSPAHLGGLRRGRHHSRAARPSVPMDDGDDVMPPSTE